VLAEGPAAGRARQGDQPAREVVAAGLRRRQRDRQLLLERLLQRAAELEQRRLPLPTRVSRVGVVDLVAEVQREVEVVARDRVAGDVGVSLEAPDGAAQRVDDVRAEGAARRR
ncbi:MAG TPA: hypothetical protein VHJ76_06605, partial [Actinomycetota bacterium]|nr:hypothetical protein [Actinomycetota bacterium]